MLVVMEVDDVEQSFNHSIVGTVVDREAARSGNLYPGKGRLVRLMRGEGVRSR
jgi:hypothetical protein